MSGLEALYRRAPYPARVVAASARGLVLRTRRYGRITTQRTAAAIDREAWSADQWSAYQQRHLADVLEVARRHVAAYRDVLPAPALEVPSFGELPLLPKERVRAAPRSFVRDDAPRRLIRETTSGTTGTPLSLYISREDYREWYALVEARWRSWYGVSRHDRWAIVGGQPVVPPAADAPPYWVWNAAMRQLYLSSYHISPRTATDYVRALDEHRVSYLLGYPSAIHALAVTCRDLGIGPRPLRVVIGNAEPVLAHQREAISSVFGCPVRETYGMAEYVAAASECDAGGLHLWPEVGRFEVLEPNSAAPVPPGQPGRFVCTSLLNRSMPLLRYIVGDSGVVAPVEAACSCGRGLPLLASVEGRTDDLVRTADGRLVGRLDPVFKGSLPIAGAQIVQEDLARFRVLVVPASGYGEDAARSITSRLVDRVGPATVEIELVESLPLGSNGKVKAVISHVTGGDVG